MSGWPASPDIGTFEGGFAGFLQALVLYPCRYTTPKTPREDRMLRESRRYETLFSPS